MTERFEQLVAGASDVCGQQRVLRRLQRHLLARLLCLGRHTITGMLTASGQLFRDWSADYRLYSADRVDTKPLFDVVRKGVEAFVPAAQPLVVAMDDSLLRKAGRKIPGAGWKRDPLGPPFQTNFVWGQRVLQLSAALPCGPQGAARMLPIDFRHAPTAKRPRKNDAAQKWSDYKQAQKELNINAVAVERLKQLREDTARPIHLVVDGRFTNATVLKNTPADMRLIGRIRADAKLYAVCESKSPGAGRPRRYGAALPTPEEIRKDDSIPWSEVQAFAAGRMHTFRIKRVTAVKWRAAGVEQRLQLIVVAPLGYRLNKNSKVFYRQPAYLICTDPELSAEQLLQSFLWRWDIEVNFRDEKSLLGVDEAQVRNPNAVANVSASTVAAYGLLLLAAAQVFGTGGIPDALPRPAWRRNEPPRASTPALINHLRFELWGRALAANLCGFSTARIPHQKPEKSIPTHAAAVLYALRA